MSNEIIISASIVLVTIVFIIATAVTRPKIATMDEVVNGFDKLEYKVVINDDAYDKVISGIDYRLDMPGLSDKERHDLEDLKNKIIALKYN